MKILYFYQYFSTPKGSWGTRVYEFAKVWVEKGHEVTVVTSIYNKSDITASKFIEDQYFDGIHVKIINVSVNNKHSLFKRIHSFLLYCLLSSYYALTLKADIVIASSGPITVGLPGLVARYFRRRKLVFETRDLWPQGAVELGIITNPIIKKIAYKFEKICYKSSSHIITLSPGMTRDIKSRFHLQNVTDVSNAANIQLFSNKASFECDKVTPKKYAIYTGNIGDVNNSEWLLLAAKCLQQLGREDLVILLIGEGQLREKLENKAIAERITNFIRLDLMPKTELIGYIQNAIVSLVPLKGTPVLDSSSPNKFFESLAAGIPVIQNTEGWMKDFLNEQQVGFTIHPDQPYKLAEKIIWMDQNANLVNEMGENSKKVAKKYFDKDYLANKMLNILIEINESKH